MLGDDEAAAFEVTPVLDPKEVEFPAVSADFAVVEDGLAVEDGLFLLLVVVAETDVEDEDEVDDDAGRAELDLLVASGVSNSLYAAANCGEEAKPEADGVEAGFG